MVPRAYRINYVSFLYLCSYVLNKFLNMKRIIFLAGLFFCSHIHAQDGLSSTEFEKRINTQQPQLLDVRTAGEYQSGHLKNSLQADWLNKD